MRTLFALMVLTLILAGCGAAAQPSSTSIPPTAVPPTSIPPTDAPVGDAQRGAQIFSQGVDGAPPCTTCHKIQADSFGFSLGPAMEGIAERAGTRVEGLDAEAYIHQSIIEPHRYVVAGFRDIMYPDYSKHFQEQDIADLIAYLLTL